MADEMPPAEAVYHRAGWRAECAAHAWQGQLHDHDPLDPDDQTAWRQALADAAYHNTAMHSSGLARELHEIFLDHADDMAAGATETDPAVMAIFAKAAKQCLIVGDPAESIHRLAGLALWMFLFGREHAVRGYEMPARTVTETGIIPDYVSDLLKEEGS